MKNDPVFNGPLAHAVRGVFVPARPDPWSEEDQAKVEAVGAVPLCLTCLRPQEGHYWFCPNCGFPSGKYAAVMPYVNIFLDGELFRRCVTGPPETKMWAQWFIFIYATAIYQIFAPVYWYWMYRRATGRPICSHYRKEYNALATPADDMEEE